jgi:hypothetical protein
MTGLRERVFFSTWREGCQPEEPVYDQDHVPARRNFGINTGVIPSPNRFTQPISRRSIMAASPQNDDRPIPRWQYFMDSTFLLLFLGVAVPFIFYTVWGIMELVNVPLWPEK